MHELVEYQEIICESIENVMDEERLIILQESQW